MMVDVHHSEHIPAWKKQEIGEIKDLVSSYPLFGIVGVGGIPAKQLQMMRRDLKDLAVLKVARITLVKRALEEVGEDASMMIDFLEEQCALIFTDKNPFKLYKLLEQGKTPSPIKAGAVAPSDIKVEKGPTSFPPGPILGDLQAAGIPAAIDGGKVVIREDKVVAEEGSVVSQKLASMLSRLEILPVEVGLDLKAVVENGSIFTPDILAIDESEYFSNIVSATQQAFNLSVNAVYPTTTTISTLISKAVSESRNVGVNAAVLEPEIMDTLLSRAHSQMMSLASVASGNDDAAVGDELRSALGAVAETVVVAEPEQVEEPVEEEKEEEEEESGMAGLGALFG
ncbi:MAG: 50S ribosomal protein L10 [Methanosarcinaceae archaeon]|nr:50S ribosomal protein L10 [Methanosarcinaceae archaeon]